MEKKLFFLIIASLIVNKQFAQIYISASIDTSGSVSDGPEYLPTEGMSRIHWVQGLSWQAVKAKAKKEKKYIFLDCFTTWCGPCKRMETETFADSAVVHFFNSKFISVRVQMDKTKSDNSFIQSWYNDAAEIARHFLVTGYPTFLFFSPDGTITYKDMGFKSVVKAIEMGNVALVSNKPWKDEYAEYEKLMSDYKMGAINYDRLIFMVRIAKKLRDTVSRELVQLHEQYISMIPAKDRYTKENIEFWASLNLSSERKIVHYFFKDHNLIDKVMNKNGFARAQVDKSIQNFIVLPFINEQLRSPDAKSDVTRINGETGVVVANATKVNEANWKKLQRTICKEFNRSYTKSNVLQAKSIWYEKNSNWIPFAKAAFEKFKIDPPDFENWLDCNYVNNVGWTIFLRIKQKDIINDGIFWMEKLIQKMPKWSDCLDTYANLLYKAGRKEEAIKYQEKVVNLNPLDNGYKKVLDQMKKGEYTYGITW